MEKIVLAAASFYNQSYFFDSGFLEVPPEIRNRIRELVIHAAQESRGVFTLGFYETGELFFETGGMEEDCTYDEIEGKLQIRKMEQEASELLNKIVLWYKMRGQSRSNESGMEVNFTETAEYEK